MNFKKELSGVAAKVAEIMEAELSAKQKAIAKLDHPKHKIDAGDLAKLRAGHKPVKEEAEQVDEGIEDRIDAARKKAKAAGKKVEEPKKPAAPAKRKVEGGAYGGSKQKDKEEMEEQIEYFNEAAHPLQKTIDHAKKSGYEVKVMKTKVNFYHPKTEHEVSAIPHKNGEVSYVDHSSTESGYDDSPGHFHHNFKSMQKYAKRGDFRNHYDEETVLPFTAMLEAYTEHGLKAFVNEQVEEEVQQEEVDNETYTKEVEDQKASMEGKKKQPKVSAASTQGVKNMDEEVEQIEEEVEQLNEYKEHIQALADHLKTNGSSMSASEFRTMHGHLKKLQDTVADLKDTASKKERGIKKHITTRDMGRDDKHTHVVTNNDGHTLRIDTARYNPERHTQIKTKSGKVIDHGTDRVATIIKKHGEGAYAKHFKEEVEYLEERTLTEPESKKKEEYVKGMKKKLSGFKQRYGERAKEVMYATATKMAKKD